MCLNTCNAIYAITSATLFRESRSGTKFISQQLQTHFLFHLLKRYFGDRCRKALLKDFVNSTWHVHVNMRNSHINMYVCFWRHTPQRSMEFFVTSRNIFLQHYQTLFWRIFSKYYFGDRSRKRKIDRFRKHHAARISPHAQLKNTHVCIFLNIRN